jgi:hypothetical protein
VRSRLHELMFWVGAPHTMHGPSRRSVAKALYVVGGYLSRVRTPRRTRRLVGYDQENHRLITEPGAWRWSPCRTSMRMLKLSMRLDWDHWDHWALQHRECNPEPCRECGGCKCEPTIDPDGEISE